MIGRDDHILDIDLSFNAIGSTGTASIAEVSNS